MQKVSDVAGSDTFLTKSDSAGDDRYGGVPFRAGLPCAAAHISCKSILRGQSVRYGLP